MNMTDLRTRWQSADVHDDLVDHAERVAYCLALACAGEPVPSLACSERRQNARDIADGAPGEAYIRCAAAVDALTGEVAPYYIASASLWARQQSTVWGRSRERDAIDWSVIPTPPDRPCWDYDPVAGLPPDLRPVARGIARGDTQAELARELGCASRTIQRHISRLRGMLPSPDTLLGGAYYGLLEYLRSTSRIDCT